MGMLMPRMLSFPMAVPVAAHNADAMITARLFTGSIAAVFTKPAVIADRAALRTRIFALWADVRAVLTAGAAISADIAALAAIIAADMAYICTVLADATVIAKHATLAASFAAIGTDVRAVFTVVAIVAIRRDLK